MIFKLIAFITLYINCEALITYPTIRVKVNESIVNDVF